MDNTIENNDSPSTIVRRSRLHNRDQPNPEMQDHVEDIFLRNMRHSYLAQMSAIDFQQQKSEISNEHELQKIEENRKDNLTELKDLEMPDIKMQHLKGDWQLFEILALKEKGQKDVELLPRSFLFCCDTNNRRLVCKAILSNSHFELFRRNSDKTGQKLQLFFAINFDTVKAEVEYQQRRIDCQLVLKTGKVTLMMKPFQLVGGQYWFKQLQKAIIRSKSRHCCLTVIDSINSFYKQRYQTQNYFVNNCKNGDILLFQDSHFMAKMQRFVTCSEYDHVGIVIRDRKHGILIFESNSGTGVCLTPWKYVVMFEWYKTIPRITWRRLQVDRPLDFDVKLQEFVVKNLPMQFHFSLAKLTAKQSFIMVDEPQTDVNQLSTNQTNGYFCSELVAKTYKYLGLLTSEKTSPNYLPASRFYPKDFSQCGQLKLQKGQLMQQREIVFDRQLLKQDYRLG